MPISIYHQIPGNRAGKASSLGQKSENWSRERDPREIKAARRTLVQFAHACSNAHLQCQLQILKYMGLGFLGSQTFGHLSIEFK